MFRRTTIVISHELYKQMMQERIRFTPFFREAWEAYKKGLWRYKGYDKRFIDKISKRE